MSTILSIALHIDDNVIPEAIKYLFNRLLQRGDVIGGTLCKKYSTGDWEILSIEELMNSIDRLNLDFIHSENALNIEVNYMLASGREILIDVDVYGKRFDAGWKVKFNGHVRLSTSTKEISRSLLQLDRSSASIDRIGYLEEMVIRDTEELFLRSCGLLTQDETPSFVMNGAMYQESGWSLIEGCFMVYHKDVEDFTADIGRMYAEYQWGIITSALLDRKNDILSMDPAEIERRKTFEPAKLRVQKGVEQKWPGYEEKKRFFDTIAPSSVEKVAKISRNDLISLLRSLPVEVPTVLYYDFQTNGSVLTTSILSSLWPAYQYIISYATSK
jgi:hypothetical protein